MPDRTTNNTRVTMAVLATKLDAIGVQLDAIERQLGGYGEAIASLREKSVAQQGQIDRLGDRLGMWAGIHTALSLLLSAIAGYLGIRR